VTGFGQTGPHASRAGYDLMAQGIGGFMSLTGTADGEPTRAGVPVADIFTGVYSVVGILAAVAERERTGRGTLVDTALVDSQVGVLANQALNFLVSGNIPKRQGNSHPNIVPYQVFPVADGHIIIATGTDSQYVKLCTVLGAPELAQQAEYRDNTGRLAHREVLIGRLTELTRRMKRDDLLVKLEAVGVPAGPINELDQVFADPQVIDRRMRLELASAAAEGGTIPGVRTPIMIGGRPMASERPSPRLGEHTTEILREIGEG
jgi:crotonobetainyl-CoA:carnitine CoA-transferase CaiB-like acyl-CoA transferase